MREIWKDVVGYEGCYMVSNMGRVKGVDRKVRTKGGGFKVFKGKILTPHPSDRPYLHVVLQKDGKRKTRRVHIIVAEAFLGKSNGLVIDHLNGIVTDNRLSNLEYVTIRENSLRGKLSDSGNKTSKYRGVYFRPKKAKQQLEDKWIACISFSGKNYQIGTFSSEYDAHLAYEMVKNNDESFFIQRQCENKDAIKGYYKRGDKFLAKYNGRHIGAFDTSKEAHEAYLTAKGSD